MKSVVIVMGRNHKDLENEINKVLKTGDYAFKVAYSDNLNFHYAVLEKVE